MGESEIRAPERVNHPSHYNANPSGVECVDVAEHMGFNLGNALKYIWRADHKGDAIEDLKKAAWYLEREIRRRSGEKDVASTSPAAAAPSPAALSSCLDDLKTQMNGLAIATTDALLDHRKRLDQLEGRMR